MVAVLTWWVHDRSEKAIYRHTAEERQSHSATRLRLAKIIESGVIQKFTIILDEEIYEQVSSQISSNEDREDLIGELDEEEEGNGPPPPDDLQTKNGVQETERINDSRPVIGSTSR